MGRGGAACQTYVARDPAPPGEQFACVCVCVCVCVCCVHICEAMKSYTRRRCGRWQRMRPTGANKPATEREAKDVGAGRIRFRQKVRHSQKLNAGHIRAGCRQRLGRGGICSLARWTWTMRCLIVQVTSDNIPLLAKDVATPDADPSRLSTPAGQMSTEAVRFITRYRNFIITVLQQTAN